MAVKLLITGGNGFIARNLNEQLGGEYEVTACGSQELNLLDTEKVYDFLKHHHFDVVIHTSTYDPAPRHSTKDPTKVLEYNLKMFFNLVRAKDHFGKMLYLGSGAEYDRLHWSPRMKEECFDQYVPSDQYGFSKYIMSKYALLHKNIFDLRIFSVFGKYEDWRYRFISRACCCALFDLPVTIKQNVKYDFLYVDDLVKIVKWFIENKPQKQIYNVCSGQAIDFFSLAQIVAKIAGKPLKTVVKSEGLGVEYSGDNDLLLSEMGAGDFTPMVESIKALYDWYSLNRQLINKAELA